jgi:hypothetical protein
VEAVDALFYSSATEALSTVGEPTRQAFLIELSHEGIKYSPGQVDLRGVNSLLRKCFGAATPVIVEKILDTFMRKAIDAGYLGPKAVFEQSRSHRLNRPVPGS